MSRIVRGHLAFEDHFTTVPNAWMRDERLSYKARGLLAHLMSHKEGWSVTVESLAGNSKDGRDSVRSGIQELEAAGYLDRIGRVRDGRGRLGDAEWVLQEPPMAENPPLGNPPTVNPPTVNPPPIEEHPSEEHLEEHLPLPGLEIVRPETVKADPTAGFAEFWALWPKKVARAPAMKIWTKAVKAADGDVSRIMAGAARERAKVDQKLVAVYFLPNPDRWLRDNRWTDHEVPAPPAAPPVSGFPDRHLSPVFDHSRPLLATQLTPEERKFLTDRAVKAGRPFGAFTELDAHEVIKNRMPK